jgi:3-oxoacyl-[acyl-carrier protein] reductase
MAKALDGKVAIVTGGSRGIGAAISQRLGRDGAKVVVNFAGQVAKADEVVTTIRKSGSEARAIQGDVSKSTDVRRLFDETIAAFGQIDILVNNAGVILYKPVVEIDEAEFDRIFSINVKGTFLTCQQAVHRMEAGGRIINFSTSVVGLMLPTYAIYAATKGAVEQLSRHLAKELGSRKITVNTIAPGPTKTELFMEGKSDADLQRISSASALQRLGETEDIADVVAFFASDDSQWVNGQTLRVNGGYI